MKGARLNNRKLKALRKDPLYEAVMIDLVLIGALEQEVVEKLIGHAISEYLVNPVPEAEDDPARTE